MMAQDDVEYPADWYSTALGTQWTIIEGARTLDPVRRREVMDYLIRRYGQPVYLYLISFLRRKNWPTDEAEDLMQGFFCRILEKEVVEKADRRKGRFRAFLKTSLKRFVSSELRKEMAKKRRPEGGFVRRDATNFPDIPSPLGTAEPESIFDYAWVAELLDEVLATVEGYYRKAGMKKHWEVFSRREVEPTLVGAEKPPLAQLCTELSIKSKGMASNMATTVRRKFKAVLRARVQQLVDSDHDVEGEIDELVRILSPHKNTGKQRRSAK